MATLSHQGLLDGVDLYKLLRYEDEELIPAMKAYGYHVAVCPEDLILGLSGCHSSFLKMFHHVAQEEQVDVYQLIVRAIDRKAPTEELLRRTAAAIKEGR